MPLNLHGDCTFFGSALPEPFVLSDLEAQLGAAKLLPKTGGAEGKKLADRWNYVRKSLRALGEVGGPVRVANHVLKPLVEVLGYETLEQQDEAIRTREGDEDAGWLFRAKDGATLRAWTVEMNADLDAPSKRGHAYRYSPSRIANRVLLTKGERLGLLTDGTELRLLICDPARTESHVVINLGRGSWRSRREPPDSFRLLVALASPEGVRKLPDLTEAARLSQTKVTAKLREQAKRAVLGFLDSVFKDASNMGVLKPDKEEAYSELARRLWAEGLVVVYRLLFILKLESSPDPARAFSFASNSLWRNTYSPNFALGRIIEECSRKGVPTGTVLSDGLRALFTMFREGLAASGLKISPLGGMLFGKDSTPLLDGCTWTDEAVQCLLGNLLWTPRDGRDQPQRVHYGSLDVEDLGRVYEALLELEPGIATEPMCRLRRAKLEVVVPFAQGEPYRENELADTQDAEEDDGDEEGADEGRSGKKTKVEWIEEIHPDQFYLRVGLGRKAAGAYYTPDAFVRFLVQETLEPQVAERSPKDDPRPEAILKLKVLDPAMGSGHFLVGACRLLADKLYEACRLCDELASKAEEQAEKEKSETKQGELRARASELRKRVEELPDPNDEIVRYLPSHVPEGEQSGISQAKALAICRRLVAVHCLYGVDKNPLAVELAKVSLWLESYAEGLPLTFLDHRLVCGDSLTGPFLADLMTFPGTGKEIDDLLATGLAQRLQERVDRALVYVEELEATVGKDVADVEAKRNAKRHLDEELAPFKTLAAAWVGGVMAGENCDDESYLALAKAIAKGDGIERTVRGTEQLREMITAGKHAAAYDLAFPESFCRNGHLTPAGFDVVVGNPPWDRINVSEVDYWSQFDIRVIDAPTLAEREAVQKQIATAKSTAEWLGIERRYAEELRLRTRLYHHQSSDAEGESTRGSPDMWRLFAERFPALKAHGGRLGFLVPSSFHANEGALGVRSLYFDTVGLLACFSFENHKRKFFDIDPRFKFDLVVAGGECGRFKARFYLREPTWLFSDDKDVDALVYTDEMVSKTGGAHRTLPELTSSVDLDVLVTMTRTGSGIGALRRKWGIDMRQEINITRGARAFLISRADVVGSQDPREWPCLSELIRKGVFTVDDDKTFHQYTDRWERWLPRYVTDVQRLASRADLMEAVVHYRLALRNTTGGRNERTAIFALLPPGHVATHKSPCERFPSSRPTCWALEFLGLVNSFPADWLFRLRVQTDMNIFMLDVVPAPEALPPLVAHSALRLSCNHEGYAPLWAEQLGKEWREGTAKKRWPVVAEEQDRWAIRAAIDAVVADAYGLEREHYEHILASFSHKSFPDAPKLCLAAFDELKKIGLKGFLKKHDPYWDVPLNQELPKPVIDLAIPEPKAANGQGLLPGMGAVESRRRPRKRT